MNEYEINSNTLAIIPINSNKCSVIEEDNEVIVLKKSTNIVNDSCKYFGSSYYGRRNGSKNILGSKHKLPIIVEETSKIIFFPTTSPRNEDCIWISLNLIEKYNKIDKNSTLIVFSCGKTIKVDIPYQIINNQILRATRLEVLYENRVKKTLKI